MTSSSSSRGLASGAARQLAGRVEALGLRLKSEKTAVTHIDEGFVFLGQRIVRRPQGAKRHVYTFVSNEALASARRKVKALTGRSTTNLELSQLIAALNRVLRGWGNYFRHAAAKRTLEYFGYYAWWRVGRWLRKKHPRMTWKQIQRRYASEGVCARRGERHHMTRQAQCSPRSSGTSINRSSGTARCWYAYAQRRATRTGVVWRVTPLHSPRNSEAAATRHREWSRSTAPA
jgi:hypothetical protein